TWWCGRRSWTLSASSGCTAWTSTTWGRTRVTATARTAGPATTTMPPWPPARRTTMQLLERMHLVQYFLFEAKTLQLDRTSAIIAPNGAGKSALLDALQLVLLGGDRRHIHFNAQAGGKARARSIR